MKYVYRLVFFIPNLLLYTFIIMCKLSFNLNTISNQEWFNNYNYFSDDLCELKGDIEY